MRREDTVQQLKTSKVDAGRSKLLKKGKYGRTGHFDKETSFLSTEQKSPASRSLNKLSKRLGKANRRLRSDLKVLDRELDLFFDDMSHEATYPDAKISQENNYIGQESLFAQMLKCSDVSDTDEPSECNTSFCLPTTPCVTNNIDPLARLKEQLAEIDVGEFFNEHNTGNLSTNGASLSEHKFN